jgi:uncharacterized 2Fe-2S/4Fe-4S cluster protein (DUF4445 family)
MSHSRTGATSAAAQAQAGITFLPDSRYTQVAAGEHLLLGAWKAGVGIKSACGGRGKCGTCLVSVESAAEGALSPATEEEAALLPRAEGGQTYRLACMAEVHGEVCVSVPPESQALKNSPRKPYTVTRVALAPAVSRVALEVEDAYAEPPRALAARIGAALVRSGRRGAALPLSTLAEFSRQPNFDSSARITATLAGKRVIQLRCGEERRLYGLAIDIGTTSMVLFL